MAASSWPAAILLAAACGGTLGYILERGDFCFHSTLRGLLRVPARVDLARAYLLAILVALPLVQGMIALGWISPWVAPWAWQANLVGGLIFGAGMVVASTCVTGIFYKIGHGMLGALVGLLAWAVGDIAAWSGPLQPLRSALNRNTVAIEGEAATVLNGLGAPFGTAVLVLLLAAGALFLWRSPRPPGGAHWGWLPLGLVVGLFTSAAWLLAKAGGSSYTFGTSGVPAAIYDAFVSGALPDNLWIPAALAGLAPGSLIAARAAGTFWARGESAGRYTQLAAGGLLMGVGAAISGGCNMGHSLVGLPLLSLGSITTTLAMLAGLLLAHRTLEALRAFKRQPVQDPSGA